MQKKICLAILLLGASDYCLAEADLKNNTAANSASVGASAPVASPVKKKAAAKKAASSATLAASSAAAAPTISGASAANAPAVAAAGNGGANKEVIPATPALAEQSIFKFGGFGSLGVSHSSMNQGDYVLDSSMPKGAGRSSDWSASNNTRVTMHVTANFTPRVSAIFQVDSEYRSDGSYRPEIEWLNVKYAFTPNFYMRVGRTALPTFMDSENRDVGYSYVWVNPPVDLYHQLSIPNSDGVDVVYRSEIGEAGNTLKCIYGSNTERSPNSVSTSKDMWGVFDTFEYGSATFHVSYQERQSSNKNLATGVTSAWRSNSDLSVGASYDPGEWFVMSEWIQRRSSTKVHAMYVSAGYRVNKYTPYFLYSQNSPGSFISDPSTLSAAAIVRANRSQSTTGLGVRWDFMRNLDFKVEYDQVRLSNNSNGYLINVPTGVTLYGSKFHVISAVVDFLF